MISSLLIFAVLLLLVVGVFLFPIAKKKIHFDEKNEAIKVYREEVAHIARQYDKGFLTDSEKKQLLEDLDKKSALAITAIEKKSYVYRFSIFPYAVIIVCLTLATGTYYQYYQKSGVARWQDFKDRYQDQITEGLFDTQVANQIASGTNLQTAADYCFAMQQALLKDYDTNPDTLANLAQCHLSAGYPQLSAAALKRGLKIAPHHPELNYLSAALSYAKTQRLSPRDIQRLSEVIKSNPQHIKALRLLAIDSLNQGNYQHAQFFFSKLKALLPDDKTLAAAIDNLNKAIKNHIDPNPADGKTKMMDDAVALQQKPQRLTQVAEPVRLKLRVVLDVKMAASLRGNQTVFIIVKSPNGQLLNATKHLISDLSKPLVVNISDNQAGAMQLQPMAGHQALHVVARISLSGSPMARKGDLTSSETSIALPQQQATQLTINQSVP